MIAFKKTYALLATGVALGASAFLVTPAHATIGMLMHCQGTENCGTGGAGMAFAQGPVDAALNPALGAKLGNQAEIAMGWFWANVKANISGAAIPAYGNAHIANRDTGWQKSGADNFPNGSLAVNYKLDDKWSANLSIYPGGGGAASWKYSRTNFGTSGGTADSTDQSMDYQSLHISPSVAYKLDDSVNVGVGLIFAYSRLETDSLNNAFARAYHGPYDSWETFLGGGFRVGATWDMNPELTLGAMYQSPVWHQNMVKYANIFNGAINQPSQLGLGGAYKMTDQTTLALDVKMVNWGSVKAIGSAPASDGGFGWQSRPVIAVGIAHQMNDALTLRAGYTYGESPIDEDHVFANVLYPAITEHHLNAGASYAINSTMELGSSAYWAPKNSMRDLGQGDNFSLGGRGTELSHEQYGFQVSFKQKF